MLEMLWKSVESDKEDSKYFLLKSTEIANHQLALRFTQLDCWKSRWLIVLRHCDAQLEMVVLIYSRLDPNEAWESVPIGSTVLKVRGEFPLAASVAKRLTRKLMAGLHSSCPGSPDNSFSLEVRRVLSVEHRQLVSLAAMLSLDRSSFLDPTSRKAVVDQCCGVDNQTGPLFTQIQKLFQ